MHGKYKHEIITYHTINSVGYQLGLNFDAIFRGYSKKTRPFQKLFILLDDSTIKYELLNDYDLTLETLMRIELS